MSDGSALIRERVEELTDALEAINDAGELAPPALVHELTELVDVLAPVRVRLVRVADPRFVTRPGTEGTVDMVDRNGSTVVCFDNGARFGLLPGIDEWEVLDG